ncbi:MAG: amidohydrolase family protein [Ignavibacteria bacterium]
MDEFIIIKNGLVLTFDRKGRTGFYNLIIRNGKVFLIDHENKFNEKEFRSKNPDAVIIDATDKLIMPGLFNSKLISAYSLNKLFFQKCNYENLSSWLSLKQIEKYLSNPENAETFSDLLKISYSRSIQNGELYINESSGEIKKDFFDNYFNDDDWIEQYFKLTVYDYTLLAGSNGQEKFLSIGFKTDENINNYSLSSIKKALADNKLKLFIDGSLSAKTNESIKKVFAKPFISVLADMELVSQGTIITNPTHLNPAEIDILKKKHSSILISPSDYLNFSEKKIDLDELIFSGINIITGTGYTGIDIMSELKVLKSIISKNCLNGEALLKTAIQNPSVIFGVSNVMGSIERNKSADIIFFSLQDARNILTLPELTSQTVCDFIIQNLTSKDISDVILKGKILMKNKVVLSQEDKTLKQKVKFISDKIYSAGNYSEYKEKYSMRGRVDKLETGYEEEVEKPEIFVDMIETGEYLGEGEFTILGTKEEDFEKPREWGKPEDILISLKEIKSIEEELNFFEETDEEPQILNPALKKNQIKTDTNLPLQNTELKREVITDELIEEKNETMEHLNTKPVLQKKKLKFGFSEDDKS